MKKRTFKKIIGLLLSMVLLIVPCSNTAMALDEQISTGEVVSQTTEYSSGNWIEADAIIPNPDYVTSESTLTQRTETAETLSTTSGVLADGVYRIKNVANGKYMDTNGGGSAAGTSIVQWDKSEYIADSDVVNLNQLFKVTYLGTSGSKEYYSIRPMTNNEMGVSAPKSSASNTVDIQSISTSETFSSIPWYQKWSIASNGSYYTMENTYVSANTYLSTPSTSTNGLQMIMASTLSTNGQWVFEAYTDSIDNIGMINFTTGVAKGYTFDFDAVMSSSTIGRNGGITYSVRNTDGTATDKATINSSTGVLTALEEGCIQIATTYTNAPWIWIWNAEIQFENGTYFFKNKETSKYMQLAYDGFTYMEQQTLDGSNEQKWEFTYDNTYGCYKIKNVDSNLYLTSPDNTTAGSNIIEQTYSSSIAERQLWNFTKLSDGSYKIQSEAREGSELVVFVDAETGSIRQYIYTDDSDYKDEWILIRMLPTSGYELDYDFASWSGIVEANCNCYAYAINNQIKSNGKIWYKQQPGEYAEISLSESDLNAPATNIISAVEKDFSDYSEDNDANMIFVTVDQYEICPTGMYKVALVIAPNRDYHWYRQDSDGLWSHKPGITELKRLET